MILRDTAMKCRVPSKGMGGPIIFLLGSLVLCGVIQAMEPPAVRGAQAAPAVEDPSQYISDFDARLALARLLSYRADQWDEAVLEYRILLKARPKDPQAATELAQLLMRRNMYPEAIGLLRTVLDQSSSLPPDVLLNMARAYAGNKDYDKAAEIYEKLLREKRGPRGEIHTELGNVHLYAGRIPQAVAHYRKALEVDPDAPLVQRQLALALSWSGRNEEALPLLARLHRDDPGDKDVAVALAHILVASGRAMEATSMVQDLWARYPGDGILAAELADLEAAAGHAAACRKLYLEAFSLVGEEEGLLLRYAAQMNLWGDFYRIETLYRNYLTAHPQEREVSIRLAWLLVSAQRYEEAEGMYLDFLRRDPMDEKALLDLGRLKLLEKDFAQSLARVERLLKVNSQHPDGLSLEGEVLYEAGRYGEALSVYRVLGEVEPGKARGALGAGKACLKQGKPDEASAYLEKALEADPRNVEARYRLAGPQRAASNDFSRALLDSPDETPSSLVEWAGMYALQGNNSMAIAFFEEALRRDPQHFPARMGLAEILAVDHQYDRSGEILRTLAEAFPDTSKILITRARVLGWSRHYHESIEVYDHVCHLNPSDPVPRKEKARTAAWGKEMDLAVTTYEESWRLPVDRDLTSRVEAIVGETGDVRLMKLHEQLRQTSRGGSIYQGYEAFWVEVEKLSDSLSPEQRDRLDEVRLELLPSYKIQKAARLESRSKWLAWNRRFARAADSYRELIGFQPGNEEAIFDYAQVDCSLGLCDREGATYRDLLAVDPLHLLAEMGLERQRIRSSPSLGINHSYWEEDGRGGLSQITRNRTNLTADIPFSCRYHLGLAMNHWLEDPQTGGRTFDAYGPTLGFSGVFTEYLTGAASWTGKQYVESGIDPTHTGFANLWLNLRDYAKLGVGYERTDELYNRFGIEQALQADSFWVGAVSYLSRDLEVKGKAQFLNYTDDNNGRVCSVSAGYNFTDHPRIIKLTLNGEYRNTELKNIFHYRGSQLVDITHPYWTPQDYFGTSAILEWYHDLSKYFFCGSELHFYALRLGGGTDTEDNPALRLEGEWHYEFKDHWTVSVKGLFHDSRQWNASGAWATIRYQF